MQLLEERCTPTFGVVRTEIFGPGALRLVADFNQAVNASSVQASVLKIHGTQSAASVSVLDADTVEFVLPTLAAGTHTASFAAGVLQSGSTNNDAYSTSFVVASDAQYTMKHNPRLQPGNAPLVGYAGSELDRVDVLWQTIPGGAGTQDSFVVEVRPVGGANWASAPLNAVINTGVENRVIHSATVTGLAWNSDYEYRVRQRQGDVIVAQYQSAFHTRLQAGDQSGFSFAAYGDSASGTALGFRQVQAQINAMNPAFAVLLGDNVYSAGSHTEFDARLDPNVNPEAAAWMAGHIDYLGLGNHDIGTGSGLPSEQNYSVPIPVAGVTAPFAPPSTERPEHSFSWDYGSVHFLTFDTNSLSSTSRLDALLSWAVKDLNASTARWKIVYGHHPLAGVPDKPENPSGNYYQQVVNRLKAAGVDLFMTGHSHTYSWTYPLTGQVNGSATYVDHGQDDHFHSSEGLTQLVSGVGGVELRSGDYSQFPYVAEGFTSTTAVPAQFGFSRIQVTPDQLTVSYIAASNGAVIDSFVIAKDTDLQTTSFQQGVNGYTGTVDTYVHQNTPTTSLGSSTSLKVDGDDPAGTNLSAQALLRFDNLFGAGAGQIPANAILRSATLQLQVTNGSVNNMNLYRMNVGWTAGETWTSLSTSGAGIQADGIEALAAPDTSSGQTQAGLMSFNVLPSLQAWLANPASNRGWAILPTGTDGVDFNSSEGSIKPKLIVSYVLNAGPNIAPVANNDTATTSASTPVTINVLANDTDANGDALVVTSASPPGHGTAVINANGSITYTPAAGYFGPDSFTYAISDGRGGSASAAVTVSVVQSASFQQGVNGYAGTVDTFLQQNAPSVSNAAATSLNVDSDDPAGTGLDVQALLRFDNLFGAGAGQIPVGASLQSARLQLQVTNAGNSVNVHRMLGSWAATATWSTFTDGVQANGTEAAVQADLATGSIATGLLTLDVLPSLLAWQSSPSSNFGWVFLPTGSDGVDFDSSEGTTKPKLIVTYLPPSNTPPTISNIADQTTNEDSAMPAIAFAVGDAETPAANLLVTATSSNTSLVPNANLVLGGTGANRTLTVTPASNQSGTTTITVTVTDGSGLSASDTFVLTVAAVNDAPVAGSDTASTTFGTPVVIAVLSNDSDIDGPTLVPVLASNPAHGSAVINANGTITYTPSAGYAGLDSFTYTASDGSLSSAPATVTVNVVLVPAKFIVVDATADDAFRYQGGGSFTSRHDLAAANTNARGVATNLDGSFYWVIDSTRTVYVYNAVLALVGSWTAGGLSTPSGITVSGNDVWIVDSGNDRAYLYAGAAALRTGSAVVSRSFALASANNNAQDLVTDGTTIWVVNSASTDRIYVYAASNGASLGNWSIDAANTTPTGLTLDPTGTSMSLWTVDSSTDRVYEYANARSRRSGSQTASTSFALDSANGNPQGIADPFLGLLSSLTNPAPIAAATSDRQAASPLPLPCAFASDHTSLPLLPVLHYSQALTEPQFWSKFELYASSLRSGTSLLFMIQAGRPNRRWLACFEEPGITSDWASGELAR